MWFKNLQLFRVSNLELSEDELSKSLSEHPYIPCKPHEETKSGWVSPLGDHSDYLTPSSLGSILMCLKVEKRTVPPNTLKEELNKQIAKLIKEDPDAKITRAMKKNIKEDIFKQLLPRAFSKYERIYAYWDTRTNYLVVDLASRTNGETFCAALRNALPHLKVNILPVQSIHEPSVSMTNWLTTGQHPANLIPQDKVSIRDTDEESSAGSISYKKQDLDDERLKGYLGESKTVSELEVEYNEKASFIVTEDLMIKSVKWFDELKEEADNEGDDNADAMFLSAFTVMQAEGKEIIKYLIEDCFGGELLEEEEKEAA